jgi:hypothetical protein
VTLTAVTDITGASGLVRIRLYTGSSGTEAAFGLGGTNPTRSLELYSDAAGTWSADLTPNTEITPAGTVYLVDEYYATNQYVRKVVSVPISADPVDVDNIITPMPGALPEPGSDPVGSATAAVAGHVASLDPHGDRSFSQTLHDNILGGAGPAFDTLQELAAALNDDANFATTMTNALAGKQAHDTDLDTIAGIDSSVAGALATDGAGWIKKTYAQLKAALGITTADVSDLGSAATHAATDFDAAGAAAAEAARAQAVEAVKADLVAGTIPDAQISAAISRDAEVTTAIAAQHTADNATFLSQSAGAGLVPGVARDGSTPIVGSQTVKHGYLVLDWSDVDNAHGPELHMLGYNGWWGGPAIDVANNPKSQHIVTIYKGNDYWINDGVTVAGSPTLTSASEGNFFSILAGSPLVHPDIPAGTTVLSVQSQTSLTMSNNATASGNALRVHINRDGVTDLMFTRHGGAGPASVGIGATPPSGTARLEVVASTTDITFANLRLKTGATQTGKALVVGDSAGNDRLWVTGTDAAPLLDGNHSSFGPGVAIQRVIVANTSTASSGYVHKAPAGQSTDMALWQLNSVSKAAIDKAGRFKTKVNSAPVLADLADGDLTFSTDATGNLIVTSRVGGVLKTATVAVA